MAMKTHGVECCLGARPSVRRGSRRAVLGLVFATLAALIPKCPMCVAAWLGVIGLSGLATRIEPRTLGFVTALFASLAVAVLSAAIIQRLVGSSDTADIANTTDTSNTAKGDRT